VDADSNSSKEYGLSPIPVEPLAVPLHLDEDGTFRVGDTRIPLERVIECYEHADSPSEIVRTFPDLSLADVFAVLGYYLRHEQELNEYRRRQEEARKEVMARIEAAQGPSPAVERLRALKRAKGPE
jgi:uncharacterized protein (DUF433 family)